MGGTVFHTHTQKQLDVWAGWRRIAKIADKVEGSCTRNTNPSESLMLLSYIDAKTTSENITLYTESNCLNENITEKCPKITMFHHRE
jgi:hypothetical protein